MRDRMTAAARRSVAEAGSEAMALGASAIEAEHLLLALSMSDDDAGRDLAARGLDHAALLALLSDERSRALGAAGVSIPDEAVRRTLPRRKLRLGRSAKDVLIRAVGDSARTHRIDSRSLLRATLRAEVGTVPRVLALAGVDGSAWAGDLE
jgi:D-alanyl-D-alanine carboxypeptidase